MSSINRALTETEQAATVALLRKDLTESMFADARHLGDQMIDRGNGQYVIQHAVSAFLAREAEMIERKVEYARRMLSAWPDARTGAIN